MKKERGKIKGIIDELICNAINAESKKITVHIENLQEEIKITVTDDGHGMTQEQVDHANHILENSRRPELEDYYGELVGLENSISGLYLVSMLSDKSMVQSKKDQGTTVTIYRKK
jgi:signal transduction histidine kinase